MPRGHVLTPEELKWVEKVFAALSWDLSKYHDTPTQMHGDEPYIVAEKVLEKQLLEIVLHPNANSTEKTPITKEIAAIQLLLPKLSANSEVKPVADRVTAVVESATKLNASVDAREIERATLNKQLKAGKFGADLTTAQLGSFNKEKRS